MAKSKITKVHYGYRLKINRFNKQGANHWEDVGFLFESSYLANEFRLRTYPSIEKYSIIGVRLDTTPINPITER